MFQSVTIDAFFMKSCRLKNDKTHPFDAKPKSFYILESLFKTIEVYIRGVITTMGEKCFP